MTGMTGKQSTARGPVVPQTTGKQSTARGPIAQQMTGMTGKQSTTRGPMQSQVTGSRAGRDGKVVPQMTGRSGRTGTTRQGVAQPAPRHPGSAVGGASTAGRAKSPLGKGSVSGSGVGTGQYAGYQSFGGAMEGTGEEDGGSYLGDGREGGYNQGYEGENGRYPGAYPGGDGNSFAGEGMAYHGEELGRTGSVAESVHTVRDEGKIHPGGSVMGHSEAGISAAQQFRTASPAGSRASHNRAGSGANGNGYPERTGTPTRSQQHSHSHSQSQVGGYAPENQYRYSRQTDDTTPTPSETGFIDRVPDMSERELLEVLKTPRTSYTVSPSVLAEEVKQSHYHDEDLCILLHAAEDPNQHEVIRKAVRKAAKMRIRRLAVEDEVSGASVGRGWCSNRCWVISIRKSRCRLPLLRV